MRFTTQSRFARKLTLVCLGTSQVVLLLLPSLLLLLSSWRTTGHVQLMLWAGTAFQLLVCAFHFLSPRASDQPIGPSIVALYLIALGWLWIGVGNSVDWFLHLAQAVLLVVPLIAFSWQILTNSGAPAIRRAQLLAQRLANRKVWPKDLAACRTLPEVKAFREALHVDAAPAITLLMHPRMEVRVAALTALEFYKKWRPGQAEHILVLSQKSPEPAFRAAAVGALANLDDRILIEALAEFLRDPSPEVRRSATEALLWDCEHRWRWIRHAVRCTLADALHLDDGPLQHNGQLLVPEAVADLHAWAAEKGVLAVRASQTLGSHYARLLSESPDEALWRELRQKLADPHTPPTLRLELARVLQETQGLEPELLVKLLDSVNPAPLRLLAAEALLIAGESEEAVAALHDIARLPNRELALTTAVLVQRHLGVDLGLPLGQPLPPVYSRQAAEVTRRVMVWATQTETSPVAPRDQLVVSH